MGRTSRYPLLSEAQWREIFRQEPEEPKQSVLEGQQAPSRELLRLRWDLAAAQAEIRRLRTPPPKEAAKTAPTDALP